jgi:anti-sigma regulatory factor (Ser/Thr protein kinase)
VHDPAVPSLRHEALLHEGDVAFLEAATDLVGSARAEGAPVVACVTPPKAALLAEAFGTADDVTVADMAAVGHNPARIIPWWRAAVHAAAPDGSPVFAIGEPVWAGRSDDELAECHQHEALLNVAFADAALRLVCPYDVAALPPGVVEEARRTHPAVLAGGQVRASEAYTAWSWSADPPLPPPPTGARHLVAGRRTLPVVRREVARHAVELGLGPWRAEELVLAVHELAVNGVEHGGGDAEVLLWRAGDRVLAEVRAAGALADPLTGRVQPTAGEPRGRGLWLVNQLCDLVQLRCHAARTVVRVHVAVE